MELTSLTLKNPVLKEQVIRRIKFLVKENSVSGRDSVTVLTTGRDTTNSDLILKTTVRNVKEYLFFNLYTFFEIPELQQYLRILLKERYLVRIINLRQRELSSAADTDLELAYIAFLLQFHSTEELFGFLNAHKIKYKLLYRVRRDPHVFVPKKHSRHRGYRDKGTLGDGLHLDKEYMIDAWLAEDQEIYEKRRKLQRDLSQIILDNGLFD